MIRMGITMILIIVAVASLPGLSRTIEGASGARAPISSLASDSCPPGTIRFLGRCEAGDPHRTGPLLSLPPGEGAFYQLENSAIVFRSIYEYGSNQAGRNGAYGANIGASRSAWFVEEQRAGGLDVMVGVLRHEPDLITVGLRMFQFALDRQAPNGSFPASAWPFHGVAMFLSEAAPSLIILRDSRYASRFSAETTRDTARFRTAAYAMVRSVRGPRHIDDTTKNHRLFEAAIALGATGLLAHDRTLIQWSRQYAWRGIRMERANGVMPENGGHDSGYQALGMSMAERYLVLLASGGLRHTLYSALQRGESWELSRIRPDGSIDQAGDTRTAGCKERGPNGQCKTAFTVPIVAAFARWAGITGDARYARAALQIHDRGLKQSGS